MHENITVNGVPLQEHISQELGNEAQSVRTTTIKGLKIPKVGTTKFSGNHSHERSGPVQIVYSPDQKAQKVIIKGTVYPWAEKGVFGFVVSGHSILGGLECSGDETEVKCHECGEWHSGIGSHITRKHSDSASEYRAKHGMTQTEPLMAPELLRKMRSIDRASFIANRPPLNNTKAKSHNAARKRTALRKQFGHHTSPATANLRMNCMAQLTVRLTNMAAKLGHCPSRQEMRHGDEVGRITAQGIRWAFNMTVSEALLAIGLTPNQPGHQYRPQKIADSVRLQILKLRSRGYSYSAICKEIGVSTDTVWRHVNGIKRETVSSR